MLVMIAGGLAFKAVAKASTGNEGSKGEKHAIRHVHAKELLPDPAYDHDYQQHRYHQLTQAICVIFVFEQLPNKYDQFFFHGMVLLMKRYIRKAAPAAKASPARAAMPRFLGRPL
jgi:hypothetical protein